MKVPYHAIIRSANPLQQTAELEELFKSKFGFTTKKAGLDCEYQKPQNQLHLEIMKFMAEHDGPHRTNLLIVYYSGHGYLQTDESEQDQLYISGYVCRGLR